MQHSPRLDSEAVLQRHTALNVSYALNLALPSSAPGKPSHSSSAAADSKRAPLAGRAQARRRRAHASRGAEPGQPPRQSTVCERPGTRRTQPREVAPGDHKRSRLHSLMNQLNDKDSLHCSHALRQGALRAVTNNYLNTRAMRKPEWEPDASS